MIVRHRNWVKLFLWPPLSLMALLIVVMLLWDIQLLVLHWLLSSRNCICLLWILIWCYRCYLVVRNLVSLNLPIGYYDNISFHLLLIWKVKTRFICSIGGSGITLNFSILEAFSIRSSTITRSENLEETLPTILSK